jgi:hypothetical protein
MEFIFLTTESLCFINQIKITSTFCHYLLKVSLIVDASDYRIASIQKGSYVIGL